MWQSLVRNWVLRTAKEQLYQAAADNLSGTRQEQQASTGEPASPAPVHVGLVFALGIEAGGLVDRLSGAVKTEGAGFIAREGAVAGRRVMLVESGAGRISAAKAAQALIEAHRPQWVISAGFAGGLDDVLRRGDILMANEVVSADGHQFKIDLKIDPTSMAGKPGLHVGRLLTVDKIVATPADKRALGKLHQALAVDMESVAVAEVCRDERVRFLAVRVISDAADHELPPDLDQLVRKKSLAGRIGAATGAIIRRPGSVKDLWQLKEDALVASERLATFLTGVIGQLPGKPDES